MIYRNLQASTLNQSYTIFLFYRGHPGEGYDDVDYTS